MRWLAEEVKRFQEWAESHPKNSAEWECEYADWPALLAAAEQVLASDALDEDEVGFLVYTFARDNECEFILEMLLEHPRNGMRVAHAAVNCSEPEARWQVAVFLGEQESDDARMLLRSLVHDVDEYTRRRALLASASRDPAFAQEIAESWLTAENEYSRLAALSVLQETHSERLLLAVQRLRQDPSSFVRAKVAEIDEGDVTLP